MSRRFQAYSASSRRPLANPPTQGSLSSASSASQAAPALGSIATQPADVNAAHSQPVSRSTSNGPIEAARASFIPPQLSTLDQLYEVCISLILKLLTIYLIPCCYNLPQVYLRAQQEIADLKSENQTLRGKLANAELKFVSNTKLRTSAIQPTADSQVDLWKEIKAIARHYQLFVTPFFEPDLLSLAPPSFVSNDAIRYSTQENQTLGKVAELYELVPQKYHHLMSVAQVTMANASSFISVVSHFH
jgi:hypothetical protein